MNAPEYNSPAKDRVPPKVFRDRHDAGFKLAANIKGDFTLGKFQKWSDLAAYGIDLDRVTPSGEPWKSKDVPIETAWQLCYVLDNFFVPRFPYWAAEDMMKAEQEGVMMPNRKKLRLTPESQCYKFPTGLTLYTEQDPAFREVMELWFPTKGQPAVDHVLIPGGTGAGKTIIAAACVYEAIHKHNYHLPPPGFEWMSLIYPVQWFTVPNAAEQTVRECERIGLTDMMAKYVHVFGYNSLGCSTALGRLTEEVFIKPEEDPFADEDKQEQEVKRIVKWLDLSAMRLLVVDECHKLANIDSGVARTFGTLRQALDKMPWLNCKSLWLSATPFEKVSDSRSFVTFAGVKYGGTTITSKNFNTMFARDVAKGAPTVVTAASMERLFLAIKRHVVELPYYPWPCKSINSVRMVDFQSERQRQYVASAWERHLDRCRALGKDTPNGVGAVYASYTIFRNDVEHVRIPQTVELMVKDVANGRSAVCGTAFTGAVSKGVFSLIDDYGVDPNQISVIWGGKANIKPDRVLLPTEMFEIIQQAMESGDGLSTENKRLIKRNLAWQQDALLFDDNGDEERQRLRYQRLQKLGMIGIQTKAKRQAEIDKMQSGQALYCFFTMASGGTGLSLPHCDSRQRPRSGYFTPIYSGKEFTQAFGRLPRRNSISDSIQQVILLNGTIESEHVAPILDLKLRAAASFTSKKTDLMAHISALFLEQQAEFEAKREFGLGQVRTLEEATKDALENEETQVHFSDGVEPEDEEDETE